MDKESSPRKVWHSLKPISTATTCLPLSAEVSEIRKRSQASLAVPRPPGGPAPGQLPGSVYSAQGQGLGPFFSGGGVPSGWDPKERCIVGSFQDRAESGKEKGQVLIVTHLGVSAFVGGRPLKWWCFPFVFLLF